MKDNHKRLRDLTEQGLTLMHSNRLEEAKALLVHACTDFPQDPQAWHLLSRVHGRMGNFAEAGECCRRVIALQPEHSESHLNLANLLCKEGRYQEAIDEYKAALSYKPDYAAAHCNLGNLLSAIGKHDDALKSYHSAIRIDPQFTAAYYNLGNLQLALREYEQAADNYRHVIRLEPGFAAAYNNLGNALIELNLIAPAIGEYRHALALNADFAVAHKNLGNALKRQGDIHAAIGHYRQAQTLKPDDTATASSLIMSMHYLPDYSPAELFAAAREWDNSQRGVQMMAPSRPDSQRKLRVGYVSGDFHHHPVGHLIEPVLAHHDKSNHEIFCYYNNDKQDDLTERLRRYADHWREVSAIPDQFLTQQIRRDGIDLLVDLSGHTPANRLPVFSRRAAPVQITWLGYFDTTGLDSIDYIIADPLLIPAAEERYYTEQVVRLPRSYLCISPPSYPIEPSAPPALTTGKITFGCFNNNAKLSETAISCWSKLLLAVPDSQLYLKYKPYVDASVRQRYIDLFARHGITPQQLRFAGVSPHDEYLAAYHDVDIALDTFPFNGCLTTISALWMGVPVVNLRGDRYVGHMGETILSAVDLEEFVTDTEEDYVATATALAADLPRLAELRRGLRQRLLNSPLCDSAGFTGNLETAYREMWATCVSSAAEPADRETRPSGG
jgi:protein O-GlcNAc transferase